MLDPYKTLLAQQPQTQTVLQPMLDHLDHIDQKTRSKAKRSRNTAELQKTLKPAIRSITRSSRFRPFPTCSIWRASHTNS